MEKMTLKFSAISKNESFARTVVSAFIVSLNPTVEELNDVKTAVSEAVTNAVVHAYPEQAGEITIECEIVDRCLHIKISDSGMGIESVENALLPFNTSKPEKERSGLGFTIMSTFMDSLLVESSYGNGTSVEMSKKFA